MVDRPLVEPRSQRRHAVNPGPACGWPPAADPKSVTPIALSLGRWPRRGSAGRLRSENDEREIVESSQTIVRVSDGGRSALGPRREPPVPSQLRGAVALDELRSERRAVVGVEQLERRTALERLAPVDDRWIEPLGAQAGPDGWALNSTTPSTGTRSAVERSGPPPGGSVMVGLLACAWLYGALDAPPGCRRARPSRSRGHRRCRTMVAMSSRQLSMMRDVSLPT